MANLTPKQKQIASAANPKDKITGADFQALRNTPNSARKGAAAKKQAKKSRMASAMGYGTS
tara:strand:+ start:201 stop:383 length:183 start_codon:yes stop_codon:yes gene_type:complete